MTTQSNTARAQEQKELDSEMTTASNSLVEKSPGPETIEEGENVETEGEEAVADANPKDESKESSEDETQYPGMVTKVGVGVGLALAVFLLSPPRRRMLNAGGSGSNHR